jgi:anti-anti-sigma factor
VLGQPPVDPASRSRAVHVRAGGELDLCSGRALADRLEQAMAERAGLVVLDLGEATFADCSTVAVVVRTARRAAAEAWTLRVLPGSPAVQRVFRLTGTLDQVPFAPGGTGGDPP